MNASYWKLQTSASSTRKGSFLALTASGLALTTLAHTTDLTANLSSHLSPNFSCAFHF